MAAKGTLKMTEELATEVRKLKEEYKYPDDVLEEE